MATSLSSGQTLQIAYFREKILIIDTSKFNSILDKVGSRPLAIISINGPMRSGKSYILNHFIRYLSTPGTEWFNKKLDNEFHWQNSSERQTTGINMWSEPLIRIQNNKEIAILLMDTQGCFDDKTTNQENALIFALSCLLSSTLIYNVPKQLAEDSLEFLHMFVLYARMSEDSSEPQTYSKLIFLIRDWEVPRDFNYGYYDDFTSAGLKNFKVEKLNVKPDAISENKIVRQEILSAFKDVGCYLMPYPGSGLAIYDDIKKVKPNFIDAIKDFVPRVLEMNIITKQIGDNEITGDELKDIVKLWAEHFATATIPEFKSINEANAEFQNDSAYSIALKYYRNEMENIYTELLDNEFNNFHAVIETQALEIFERMKRVHNDDIKKKYSDSLKDAINELYKTNKQFNVMHNNFEQFKVETEEECKKKENEMHNNFEQFKLKTGEEKHKKEIEMHKNLEQLIMQTKEETQKKENEMLKNMEIYKSKTEEERKRMENEMRNNLEQYKMKAEEERTEMEIEMQKNLEQLIMQTKEETQKKENEMLKNMEIYKSKTEEERKKMENEMQNKFEHYKIKALEERQSKENEMRGNLEKYKTEEELEEQTKRNEMQKDFDKYKREIKKERKEMENKIRIMKKENEEKRNSIKYVILAPVLGSADPFTILKKTRDYFVAGIKGLFK